MGRSRSRSLLLLVLLAVAAVAAVLYWRPDIVRRAIRPSSPHERYADALARAGLADTALGRAWTEAAHRAIDAPVRVALPFREVGQFAPTEAVAAGYQFDVRRGQRLVVECRVRTEQPFALFVDLFERGETPRRIASAESGRLDHEAERDATYIVRVQPELLRGGRYELTQRLSASLTFPVPDAADAVHSVFGDPRDAGRRQHEGIDIFVPRGTKAVAAADGIVGYVGRNRLGGNVVFVWSPGRRLNLYYAHLESQTVRAGQLVTAGETVGLVGNTGNARTTKAHLHFGIYTTSGALDPLPFVVAPPGRLPPIPADLSPLGGWRRIARNGARLAAGDGAEAIATLPRDTLLRVDGASGARLRVRLADGTPGFVARADTEPAADMP